MGEGKVRWTNWVGVFRSLFQACGLGLRLCLRIDLSTYRLTGAAPLAVLPMDLAFA